MGLLYQYRFLPGPISCFSGATLEWFPIFLFTIYQNKCIQIQGMQDLLFSESVVFENSELAFVGTDLQI